MKRLHRVRQNQLIRDLCAQGEFTAAQLIQPLFVVEGLKDKEEIPGLRGNFRLSSSDVIEQMEADVEAGIRQFILFPVPASKQDQNISHDFTTKVISQIKKKFSDNVFLWIDTCLCTYTTHGHCCLFEGKNIHLENTLKELERSALSFADAGADGVSPSDMMDHRVASIRKALDEKGFQMMPIMSYSTKFSSNFYGPFRNVANSSPSFGDRKQYQIDVRNRNDAMASSLRCAQEGADLLMVKPGMTSIDLIGPIHSQTGLPVGAYQVSGEYASLVLLAEKGLIDMDSALLETWQVFKRAGAQFIISYGARLSQKLGIK